MSQDYTRPWGSTDQQNKHILIQIKEVKKTITRQCEMCFGKGITGCWGWRTQLSELGSPNSVLKVFQKLLFIELHQLSSEILS